MAVLTAFALVAPAGASVEPSTDAATGDGWKVFRCGFFDATTDMTYTGDRCIQLRVQRSTHFWDPSSPFFFSVTGPQGEATSICGTAAPCSGSTYHYDGVSLVWVGFNWMVRDAERDLGTYHVVGCNGPNQFDPCGYGIAFETDFTLAPSPYACMGRAANLWGTPRADVLVGTNDDDVVAELDGNDVVDAAEGNDLVCGGSGRDELLGGPGDDELHGEAGRDSLNGGSGDDTFHGRPDWDTLRDGAGSDTAFGGPGNDRFVNGPGFDTFAGGAGTDRLDGCKLVDPITIDLAGVKATHSDAVSGVEQIIGGMGDDRLSGDGRANLIIGREGDDRIEGRGGDDRLIGNAGDDVLVGQGGDDVLRGQSGTDRLIGGGGEDEAHGGGASDRCSAETEVDCEI